MRSRHGMDMETSKVSFFKDIEEYESLTGSVTPKLIILEQ